MPTRLPSFAEVDSRSPIQDTASIQLGVVKRLPLGNRRADCRSSFEDLDASCIALTFRSVFQSHVVCESVDDAAVSGRNCAWEDQSLFSFRVLKKHKFVIVSERSRIIQINICTSLVMK